MSGVHERRGSMPDEKDRLHADDNVLQSCGSRLGAWGVSLDPECSLCELQKYSI